MCVEGNAVYLDEWSVKYLAERLAKAGVNLVRVHNPVMDWNQEDNQDYDPKKIDEKYIAKLHDFVWAMKQEGI